MQTTETATPSSSIDARCDAHRQFTATLSDIVGDLRGGLANLRAIESSELVVNDDLESALAFARVGLLFIVERLAAEVDVVAKCRPTV